MDLLITLILLCVLLIFGVPVPFSFLAAAAYLVVAADYAPSILLPYGFSKMNTIILLAIPLFIIAGGIMERGGIGKRLVDLIEVVVGKIKGGLGAVSVVACAVFGSITGSATATLSSIGSVMFPRLKEAGYPRGYSAALIANSSVLGMLIPPSSIMILYAWIGGQSVLASFLSTVVPGIILATLLIIINMVMVRKYKGLKIEEKSDFITMTKDFGRKTGAASAALMLPIIVLGGIYGGFMTTTEAAAIAAIYSIPVGFFIYKGLNWKSFKEILVEAATTTGVVMVMLFAVTILGRLYVMENVPTQILNFLTSISENSLVLLLMLNIFMIIIGMIMDDVSAVMLCTPILLPVAIKLGIDPIHFAGILAVNLGMGNMTPPAAPLLYLGGRVGKAPINEMMKPSMIMILFAWLPTLVLTTYIPELSLWLPRLILGS